MYSDQPLFYFAVGARPLTYSFLSGMPLRVIEGAIKGGRLWIAERINKTEGIAHEENDQGGKT